MINIFNNAGKKIFTSEKNTLREAIVEAAKDHISLYEANLHDADLSNLYLKNIDLRCANLIDAKFDYSNLESATLKGARLNRATLKSAILDYADLSCTILSYSNLHDISAVNTNFRQADCTQSNFTNAFLIHANFLNACCVGANFTKANCLEANFCRVTLYGAELFKTNFTRTICTNAILKNAMHVPNLPLACPSEGSFEGWKKVIVADRHYLVHLFIPKSAKRISSVSRKCRCDKAKVLDITLIHTGEKINKIKNTAYTPCEYIVGKMVYPDSFDEDRWNECSHGIHFFINKQDALDY